VAGLLAPSEAPALRCGRRRGPAPSLLRTVLADTPFLLFLCASLAVGMVYFQQQATLPLQVVADGHSTAIYGSLMSLNGLVVTLVELPSSAITRKFRPGR